MIVLIAVEDFQIDEFAIHTGEWNENVYTADCSVLDGVFFLFFLEKFLNLYLTRVHSF